MSPKDKRAMIIFFWFPLFVGALLLSWMNGYQGGWGGGKDFGYNSCSYDHDAADRNMTKESCLDKCKWLFQKNQE